MPCLWRLGCLLSVAAFLFCFASCTTEQPPRSQDEILREELELPALYMTSKSEKRVKAPASKGLFVDKETGEILWPAKACHNPDCPARGPNAELNVFVVPDLTLVVDGSGTIAFDPNLVGRAEKTHGLCPACVEKFNLASTDKEKLAGYVKWVKPHVLPETEKRRKVLAEERTKRREYIKKRMESTAGS